ncbi:CPBP family intramembrane glutamic endopeptidase [Hyphomonas johnsonii]|uniref:CAAX protease self-immunity protein family n=1 Tax=Hyphomonas johnsonii MHS-2 TaxID=1280950 RepID=A0A059FFW5_9PROT|nr:CPBP family intramembrane glutamic endopeptidase [Hyphomonas johnsonii]KCZ89492.1 CAAX protease self-immunity protein family [Hyphomonas johnsonii MHS-2]
MLVQEIVNTLVQALVVLALAGIAYAFAGKRRGKFRAFTGLYLPPSRSWLTTGAAALVLIPLSLALVWFTPLKDTAAADNTITGMLAAKGFSAEIVAVILLIALVKTSFTEELFFRGLLAKRLIVWLGMPVGNTLHAALFGAIHLIIFVAPGGPDFSVPLAAGIFLIPAIGGWVMAWLNETVGDGSVLPGWFVHALTNLLAYPLLAFG